MIGLMAVCTWQILSGPQHHDTPWHLPANTYVLLALVNIVGTLAILSATVQADAWTAGAFEFAGTIILCGTMSVYLYSVITTAQYADTDLVTALIGGLLAGLVWRVIAMGFDVVGIVSAGIAPPIGDMDLVTADKVNATTDLIAASHGGGIERQAVLLDTELPPRHAAP